MKRAISASLNQETDTTTFVGTMQEVSGEDGHPGTFGASIVATICKGQRQSQRKDGKAPTVSHISDGQVGTSFKSLLCLKQKKLLGWSLFNYSQFHFCTETFG